MKTGDKVTVELGIDLLQGEIIELTQHRGTLLFRIDTAPNEYFSEEDIVYDD